MQKDIVYIGQKFNFLTVISEPYYYFIAKKSKGKQKVWKIKVKCDCGIEKDIRIQGLIKGTSKSCGCYNRKAASERIKKTLAKPKHNLCNHPLYQSWKSIKNKCYNKKSPNYLNGIKICNEWLQFNSFYEWGINNGWKENLVISRKDNLKNFTPENCIFKTKAEIIVSNINIEKGKQTCLRKHGVTNLGKTKKFWEKVRETCLKKYGDKFPQKTKEIKEKIKRTCLTKYGTENPLGSKLIQEKIKKTNLERYGVKYPTENKQIREKQINSLLLKYGKLFVSQRESKFEKEIKKFLIDEFNYVFSSNYKILNGKQIDLYNKDLKLGIEFCGLYWHTEDSPEPRLRSYHYNKYKKCLEQNIRLITIFSDEWINRKEQVKGFLRSVINKNENKVFARKCEIKEINYKIGKEFFKKYHIQGQKRTAKVYYGLLKEEELLGVISLNLHHRDNSKLVLDRLCFKENFTIIGGASKLFKKCIEWAKLNNFNQIISWSDNRWSNGNIYKTLGFKLEKRLAQDYSYVNLLNPVLRKSKQSMKKKNNISEKELAENYSKIWDCGKLRWVYGV